MLCALLVAAVFASILPSEIARLPGFAVLCLMILGDE